MKLYSGPVSMFGAKAQMAAIEKGLDVDVEFVPFSLQAFYSPKHPEVLRINPKAEVPVLIDGDLELFDSTQIFEYFERIAPDPPLWPLDLVECARARLLELRSDEVLFPEVVCLMPNRRAQSNSAEIDAVKNRISKFFAEIDSHLAGRDYLSDGHTYADLAFYTAQFLARTLGVPAGQSLRHVEAWRQRMNERDSVQRVMGAMAEYLSSNGVPTEL